MDQLKYPTSSLKYFLQMHLFFLIPTLILFIFIWPLDAKEVATPQKLIKTESGLEVPTYILKRAIERKKEALKPKAPTPQKDLPLFHVIGVLATEQPMAAGLGALVLGAILGHWFYGYQTRK